MTVVEHQPREHAVLCRRCMRRDTWSVDAVCDTCRDAEQSSRAQLAAIATTAKQKRLLDLTVQYVHTVSQIGRGVILTEVAELLPEIRTVEQVLVWDNLRKAVLAYEFDAGTLSAVEAALAAA